MSAEATTAAESDDIAPAQAGDRDAVAADLSEARAEHDDSIAGIVAAKILVDWLRNRQQLLVPFSIDLQKLEAAQVDILVHTLVAAAQADGAVAAAVRQRANSALKQLNAGDDHGAQLDAAMEDPKPLSTVLAGVTDVQTGATAYAASLLAIDRRKLVNRQYLRYLAARLQLPRDLARALEQRFVASAE